MPTSPPRFPSLDDEDDLQHILDRELFDRDARWPGPALATARGSNRRPTPSHRATGARRERGA